jgi:hypothetical protein
MIAAQEKIKGQNFTSRLLASCFGSSQALFEINFLLAIAARRRAERAAWPRRFDEAAIPERSGTERYFCQTFLSLLTLLRHLAGQAGRFLMLGLLHVLQMRRGYCISANFVESSSSVHHRL